MEILGNLVKKLDERSGEGVNGPWKFASYLLDTVEMRDSFPVRRKMVIEVSDGESGRINKFDRMFGRDVIVRYDIDATEYNGKWYNHIRAYGIKELESTEQGAQGANVSQGAVTYPPGADDLPY